MNLVVREHDTLVRASETVQGAGNQSLLAASAFDAVQEVMLGEELAKTVTPARLEGRDTLKLSSWVGLLRTPDGTTVEILPKIVARGEPGEVERSRDLLLRMLRSTDAAFKVAPPADLDPARMPLFESLLLTAVSAIRQALRRGLPHAYVPVEEERGNLRGRLNLERQLRQLPHRAHRLQVRYDEYLPDRPETRLVRSTAERVLRLTGRPQTARLAREVLTVLHPVPPSVDFRRDFAAWRLERGQAHFAGLQGLCRLVLERLNPLVGGMTAHTAAVLYDMNVVFERYVAAELRRACPEWRVQTQQTAYLGHVGGKPAIEIRPDLVITPPDGVPVVADTKWKRLQPGHPTLGVDNADVYQMLSYGLWRESKRLLLLYPWVPGVAREPKEVRLPAGHTLHIAALPLSEPESWAGMLAGAAR